MDDEAHIRLFIQVFDPLLTYRQTDLEARPLPMRAFERIKLHVFQLPRKKLSLLDLP